MIVDPDFCDHWKVRMLVGLLDGDEVAPVYVLRLWAHCQNRKKASFENLPTEAIKALCRYSGDAARFEGALTAAGFVDRQGDRVVVVGWDEYNAQLIAAWENGSKGGRPSQKQAIHGEKPQEKPKGNPRDNPRDHEEIGTEEIVPPPPREASLPGSSWQTLRAAWNAGTGRPWRPTKPPDGTEDRLAEPGWLEDALEAIKHLPKCGYFKTPVTLVQLVAKPGFARDIVGGRYDSVTPKRRDGDERPVSQKWTAAEKAALEATRRKVEAGVRIA